MEFDSSRVNVDEMLLGDQGLLEPLPSADLAIAPPPAEPEITAPSVLVEPAPAAKPGEITAPPVQIERRPVDIHPDEIDQDPVGTAVAETTGMMSNAIKHDPAKHAENVRLSDATGLSIEAVGAQTAAIKKKLDFERIDFPTMVKESPNTARFINANPDNAIIAQNDLEQMGAIEKVFTSFTDLTRSTPAGVVKGASYLVGGAGRTLDIVNRTAVRGLDAILPEGADKYLWMQPDSPEWTKKVKPVTDFIDPGQAIMRMGGSLTDLGEFVAPPVERQNAATMVLEGVGQLGFQIAAAMVAPITVVPGTFFQGVELQGRKQDETGTYGQNLYTDAADLFGGVITGTTEKIPIDMMLKKIPVEIRHELASQVLKVLGAAGAEGVQELVEGIAQNILEYITTNPEADIFEGAAEEGLVAGGAAAFLQALILTATPGKQRTLENDIEDRTIQSAAGQLTLDTLNEQAMKSDMRENSPEKFAEFVESLAKDGADTVYIDGELAFQYLQQKTLEEIQLDPALKLLASQVGEAAALNGEVVVPVGVFASDFAATEHFEALRDGMTMSAEALPPMRQDAGEKVNENHFKYLLGIAEEGASDYAEAQDIAAKYTAQLADTGRMSAADAATSASLIPAYVTAHARANNKSVAEAARALGMGELHIDGPQTGEMARLSAEALPQEPAYSDAPDVFDMVKNKFLSILPEDADVDEVIAVVNEEGFSREYKNFIKALDRDGWLGFDYPSQAISAALSGDINDWDPSQGLKASIGKLVNTQYDTQVRLKIEENRSARFEALLSPEDRMLANKMDNGPKRDKFIQTLLEKSDDDTKTETSSLLERNAAEDALASPKSSVAEKVAAKLNIDEKSPYNPAEVSDVTKSLAMLEDLESVPTEGKMAKIAATRDKLKAQPISTKQDFGDATVSEEVEVEGAQGTATVTQSAQKVFDDTMQRRNVVEQLARCVGNA
jgi:hypothetical protein